MITIQLLIQNNEKTINRFFRSIEPLGAEVLVGDIGCSDSTKKICEDYGAEVFNVGSELNLSDIRNRLILKSSYDWNMLMYPWEALDNYKVIEGAMDDKGQAYRFSVLQNTLITKEVRLWDKRLKYQFVNPVYEYLEVPTEPKSINSFIYSGSGQYNTKKMLDEWRENYPAARHVMYYQSCYYLSKGDWNRFALLAEQYLFGTQKADIPTIMTKYYYALALCHAVKKNIKLAIKNLLECIAIKPLMAEFWCALGDVYYKNMKDYAKARQFYRNAITLGSRRPQDDAWPIDIPKYRDYPERLIESCEKLLQGTERYVVHPIVG